MKRLIAVMAVIALLAAGCGDDEDDGGAATTTTEAPATTQGPGEATALAVETSGTNEKLFTAPAEISGGVVNMTFKNNGKLTHEASLLEVGDRSEDEVLRALKTVVTSEEGVPIPASVVPAGGLNEIKAGQSAASTVLLPAGRYLVICTLTDADSQEPEEGPEEGAQPQLPLHFEQGMRKSLTVTGGGGATLPERDGTIVGREYGFDVPANLTAGRRELVFRNEGPKEIHVAALSEFPAGVDEAAARRAFEALIAAFAENKPPPEGTPEPEDVASSSIFDVNRGGTFTAELRSGRTYAVVCFVTDRAGGPPHVAKGMLTTFRVE